MDKAVFDLYKGKIFFCLVSLQFLAGPVIIESKYGSPKICPHLVIILPIFFSSEQWEYPLQFFLFAIQSMRNYMSGPVILGWAPTKQQIYFWAGQKIRCSFWKRMVLWTGGVYVALLCQTNPRRKHRLFFKRVTARWVN